MTIKVYMNDERIEEYPNAHIYWEWDESEKGTDSGFRINSIDRNFTSVVAFIHPGDCKKIEITSEECDRIFKSPPKEDSIPIKRWKIFKGIHKERIRQDDKWGEKNHPMLAGQTLDQCLFGVNRFKELNAVDGACSWFSILMEEIYEAFAETSIEKQREEMEQVATAVVQIIECIDRKLEAQENEREEIKS
jgi:hypothetical protein